MSNTMKLNFMPPAFFQMMNIINQFDGGEATAKAFKNVDFGEPKKAEPKIENISEKEEFKALKVEAEKVIAKATEKLIDNNNDKLEALKKEANKLISEAEKKMHPQDDDSIITMEARPVPTVPFTKIDVQNGDESLKAFEYQLQTDGIPFITTKRNKNTKLAEVTLANHKTITVDIDNLLGYDRAVFWTEKIGPLDEYKIRPAFCSKDSLACLLANDFIAENFYVPEEIFVGTALMDISTLKMDDTTEKYQVITKAVKSINSKKDEIDNNTRFVFANFKNINEFTLVSSNKSRVSNLEKHKIRTNKTVTLTVKGNDVEYDVK